MILTEYTPAKLYTCGEKLTGRWYAYFSIRDPETRKLRLRKLKAGINRGKTIKERKRYGAMVVSEINNLLRKGWRGGKANQNKNLLPMKDTLLELLEIKKGTLRRRTWQSYKYSIDVFTKWMKSAGVEYIYPEHFTSVMAHDFSDYLQLERKLKGKGFNSAKNNLNIMLNMMVERELMPKNHLSKIKNLKEEVGKNIAFTEAQRLKLTNAIRAENFRLYMFTQFVYFCYIRPLELLRLTVANFDLENKIITIYGNQSKNKKTDVIVIPDAFFDDVKLMELEKFPREYFVFGQGLQTTEGNLSRNTVTKIHKTYLTKLKFSDDYTLYSHKHSGVVSAYHQGIDIYSIMRQCRHGSIHETQHYLKSLGLLPNVEFASKMK